MITILPYPSEDHVASSVIEVDLTQYIESIEKKIIAPTPEHIEQYEQSFQLYAQLVEPIVGELHWMNWFSKAVEGSQLSAATIQQLKQCPAYKILADISTTEILKNAMDECLFAYFSPHSIHKSKRVQLVMAIHVLDDQFCFEFTDSGRGFPDGFLARVQDNSHKAEYLCQSDSHRRHDSQDSELLFKSFGGHGIGLRELISLVQCGQHLLSIKSKIIVANPQNAAQTIEAGMANNYRVEFSNQSGACIRVITPHSEHETRDQYIVLPKEPELHPEFLVNWPNFSLLSKSSMWQRQLKKPIEEAGSAETKKAH
jgi:hypothetical protein